MWLLILLSAYAIVRSDCETQVFRKCCSRDNSLITTKNDGDEHFDCLDRESIEIGYNVSQAPLVISEDVIVEDGFPKFCENWRMDQLSSSAQERGLLDSENYCYDKLVLEIVNGSKTHSIPKIVALSCLHNDSETIPDSTSLSINHMRKCCKKGQSYDPTSHLCKSDVDSTEEWLVGNLNVSSNIIYGVANSLHCKADEYGVELSEELFSLEVEGSSLRVKKRSGVGGGLAMNGQWCVDKEMGRESLIARVCTRDCAKYGAYCLRKCCPIGQHYLTRYCGSYMSICVPNDSEEISVDFDVYLDPLREQNGAGIADVLGIRTDLYCKTGKAGLNRSLPRDRHQLTKYGHLKSPVANNDDYCIEAFDSRHCPGGEIFTTALFCFVKQQTKDYRISFVTITVSNVCLALTLIVYCALPELRNLHGRTLICHVAMMLLAFSCLARVQYSDVPDETACTLLGYGIYFGFVAAFAWLNVMCLDIWWTFGSMRTVQPLRKAGTERRRFLWFSLYAWSITIIMTVTMFLFDRYPVSPILDANMGYGTCWFGTEQNSKSDWPHYIFFVIPLGLSTCTNFVLFMLTARHCSRVKSEVHRMQAGSVGDRAKRRFRVDRAKYLLSGKLWVVMGAGWVAELGSTLTSQPQWLWTIVDLINELQGVFIFLILIFKPKLYYLIRKRLGLEKPEAQKQGTSSGRTSSTFLSRTISADERATLRISNGNTVKQP